MSTKCAGWGNEISMMRFLVNQFTDPNYYPIQVNEQNLNARDPKAQQSDLFRLLNISATKALTPNANNEIMIRNIFDVFAEHTSDMAKLNAFGMPLLDMMKWLNYKESTYNEDGTLDVTGVRKSLDRAFGDPAYKYILQLIKDINGTAKDSGELRLPMKFLRNAKAAAVAANLRVALLQPTAYFRAQLVLSTDSLVKAALNNAPGVKLKTVRNNIAKAEKYCGIALWKSYGFFDTNITKSVESQIKGDQTKREKIIEKSLFLAEWGDKRTWGTLWNACEYEVAKKNKYKYKVGSEEFNLAVAEKLREVIYQTQVVDSVLTRSQMMRKKSGLTQTITAFMSEPTLSFNILMDGATQVHQNGWKKAGKYFGRAVATYAITQIIAALVEGLWDAVRDSDDDDFHEKLAEHFIENFRSDINPFNKVPLFSDINNLIYKLFGIGFFDSSRLDTQWLTQISDLGDAWTDIHDKGATKERIANLIYKTLKVPSTLTGVPISNGARDLLAVWNTVMNEVDPSLKMKMYVPNQAQQNKSIYNAIIKKDTKRLDALKKQFNSQSEYQSAVRAALRDNDKRITEAAKAKTDGDLSGYESLVKEIESEGHFSRNDIVKAVTSAYNKLNKQEDEKSDWWNNETEEEVSTEGIFYNSSDVITYLDNGDYQNAKKIVSDVINEKVKSGKTQKQARAAVRQSISAHYKQDYLDADEQERVEIRRKMYSSGVYDSVDDVVKLCNNWVTKNK